MKYQDYANEPEIGHLDFKHQLSDHMEADWKCPPELVDA